MVQRPTCTGIRVRSIADCNVILHAVSLGILPLVSRRLSIEERRAIHSGCVFVWEERTPTIEAAGVSHPILPVLIAFVADAVREGRLGAVDRLETLGS